MSIIPTSNQFTLLYFDGHLQYASQIQLHQRTEAQKQIENVQYKFIRVINFESKNNATLYKTINTLKLNDVTFLKKCKFVLKNICTKFLSSLK